MRHDRGLEEPPEHPDDCGCRDCRTETTAMLIAEDEASVYDERNPYNDTHLCSGGPEEITDEEWELRQEQAAREWEAPRDPSLDVHPHGDECWCDACCAVGDFAIPGYRETP